MTKASKGQQSWRIATRSSDAADIGHGRESDSGGDCIPRGSAPSGSPPLRRMSALREEQSASVHTVMRARQWRQPSAATGTGGEANADQAPRVPGETLRSHPPAA